MAKLLIFLGLAALVLMAVHSSALSIHKKGGGDNVPAIGAVKLSSGVTPVCTVKADVDKAIQLVGQAATNTKAKATSGVMIKTKDGDSDLKTFWTKYVQKKTTNPLHRLFQFAPENVWVDKGANVEARCYDPDFPYEDSLDAVTVNSVEFKAGCTAVRTVAKRLQTVAQCLDRTFFAKRAAEVLKLMLALAQNDQERQEARRNAGQGSWKEGDEEVLKRLAFYASTEQGTDALRTKIKAKLTVDGTDENQDPVELDIWDQLGDCFNDKNIQHTLSCYSVLTHASGQSGNGIDSHNMAKLVDTKTKPTRKCAVHPVCARLGAVYLVNFSAKAYDTMVYWDLKDPKWSYCQSVGGTANCRVYPRCMELALRRVCSNHAECCTSTTQHNKCKAGVDGSDCAAICGGP